MKPDVINFDGIPRRIRGQRPLKWIGYFNDRDFCTLIQILLITLLGCHNLAEINTRTRIKSIPKMLCYSGKLTALLFISQILNIEACCCKFHYV